MTMTIIHRGIEAFTEGLRMDHTATDCNGLFVACWVVPNVSHVHPDIELSGIYKCQWNHCFSATNTLCSDTMVYTAKGRCMTS